MKAIIFGATGMVGQSVLRECLLDTGVVSVLTIGRRPTGSTDAKLREVVHSDFSNFSSIEAQLTGYDACFFCLGVSSAGMSERDYRRVTYDFTIAAATTLARLNPGMTFVYVTGVGTDSTERGRTMWARVKGATENALLKMPFKGAYMFRPGYIQPMHGVQASGRGIRLAYRLMAPLYPLWKLLFPRLVTTSQDLGRAMIHVARHGATKHILEPADFAALAGNLEVRAA
jgi:uncharacterized protein YbjT (DUF2867 family)